MNQEDRERQIRMEETLESIQEGIHGERGILNRMDRHSDRIYRIERVLQIGSGVVLAISAGAAVFKDALSSWIKHKVLG